MIEFNRFIPTSELRTLAGLIGLPWEYYGSEWPKTENFIEAPVIVESGSLQLALTITVDELDVDEDLVDVSFVTVEPLTHSVSKSLRNGNIYFQGKGETVENIYIVRESLGETHMSNRRFVVNTDCGVVIERSDSALSLTTRGLAGEDFVVSEAKSVADLTFYNTLREWSDTLMTSFDFQRTLIPVGELIN
jgi:sulfur relay (sulfurtransferase) DsrF/TusC family protein